MKADFLFTGLKCEYNYSEKTPGKGTFHP